MFTLAIHGGAGLTYKGSLSAERETACEASLRRVLALGAEILQAGGSALDAVEAAVVALEDDPLFNAGRGAVLANDGTVELDAAIMDGISRRAGAVAGAKTVRNPIRLARAVMEGTPHVMLVGEGADRYAVERGLPTEPLSYFVVPERLEQLERARTAHRFSLAADPSDGQPQKDRDVYGTVGAVACDQHGHLAVATSTGGMTNKRPGRVGDSPIVGAGTYAWDATVAVSGTGHGEPFVRLGVAHRVSALVELLGLDVAAAAERVIHQDLLELGGRGGLIAVDRQGGFAMPFNTAGMFRGVVRQGTSPEVAIW
jgi:beta-aspartyl-peptidase (threonine type)